MTPPTDEARVTRLRQALIAAAALIQQLREGRFDPTGEERVQRQIEDALRGEGSGLTWRDTPMVEALRAKAGFPPSSVTDEARAGEHFRRVFGEGGLRSTSCHCGKPWPCDEARAGEPRSLTEADFKADLRQVLITAFSETIKDREPAYLSDTVALLVAAGEFSEAADAIVGHSKMGEVIRFHLAVAAPALDTQLLAEAARSAGRSMNVPLLANPVTWRDFADEIVAQYLSLSESAPPVAPRGETDR